MAGPLQSWFENLPIKRKVSFSFIATTLVSLLIVGVLFAGFEYLEYKRLMSSTVQALARVTAENSTATLAFDDEAGAKANLHALRAEPQIRAAILFRLNGEPFAQYLARSSGRSLPTAAPPFTGTIYEAGRLVHVEPVIQDGNRLGSLYLEASLHQLYGRMWVQGGILAGVLAVALLVALLLTRLMQHVIARPIVLLTEAADSVASGQASSIRANLRGRDEIGRLSTAFNAMIERTESAVAGMEKARDTAIAASRAKDRFLATLSHELRTPLNPVLIVASESANDPTLPETTREDFRMIAHNVSLEARLIDDLLDLTRIAEGKIRLEKRPMELDPVIRDAVATVEPASKAKGVSVVLELGAPGAEVLGDPIRLQQVFWNILANAIKFTPPSGRVRGATRICQGRVIVEFSDTGIGMSDEELSKVFDAFAQGGHADGVGQKFGGVGLGLTISRRLVELHGGSIRAASDGPGHGSTVTVQLPLTERTPPTMPPPTSMSPTTVGGNAHTTPAATPTRPVVLIVEDHSATALTVANLLERRGFETVCAGTLAAARFLAAARPIDLLLSDIGLPDGDGWELLEELRRTTPDLPAIALSGFGAAQDVARSLKSGFRAHLIKPIHIRALEQVLAEVFVSPDPDPLSTLVEPCDHRTVES